MQHCGTNITTTHDRNMFVDALRSETKNMLTLELKKAFDTVDQKPVLNYTHTGLEESH